MVGRDSDPDGGRTRPGWTREGLTRREALAAVGGLGAAAGSSGCLALVGGGRETVVLTGVQLYNWTGSSIEVEVTVSNGSETHRTTEAVPNGSTASVPREWGSEASTYDLEASVVDASLGVDATLPDGSWTGGRCAWAEVDFGSPNNERAVGGGTETASADVRLRVNDEGPFGDQCPE